MPFSINTLPWRALSRPSHVRRIQRHASITIANIPASFTRCPLTARLRVPGEPWARSGHRWCRHPDRSCTPRSACGGPGPRLLSHFGDHRAIRQHSVEVNGRAPRHGREPPPVDRTTEVHTRGHQRRRLRSVGQFSGLPCLTETGWGPVSPNCRGWWPRRDGWKGPKGADLGTGPGDGGVSPNFAVGVADAVEPLAWVRRWLRRRPRGAGRAGAPHWLHDYFVRGHGTPAKPVGCLGPD